MSIAKPRSAASCAALADWLFFGWQVGISLALFFAAIGVVAVAVNGVRAQRRTGIVMTSIFVAGLLTLVEEVSTLSVIWSALSTASFVIVKEPGNWRAWGFRTWRLERYFANTPPERLNSPDGTKG